MALISFVHRVHYESLLKNNEKCLIYVITHTDVDHNGKTMPPIYFSRRLIMPINHSFLISRDRCQLRAGMRSQLVASIKCRAYFLCRNKLVPVGLEPEVHVSSTSFDLVDVRHLGFVGRLG